MNISTMYSFKIAYFDDKLLSSNKTSNVSSTVADPGFDLGGWTLSTGGWGWKILIMFIVEVKVIFFVFLAIFLLKLCLKLKNFL